MKYPELPATDTAESNCMHRMVWKTRALYGDGGDLVDCFIVAGYLIVDDSQCWARNKVRLVSDVSVNECRRFLADMTRDGEDER